MKLEISPAPMNDKISEIIETEESISKPVSAREPQQSKLPKKLNNEKKISKFYEKSYFTDMIVNEELDDEVCDQDGRNDENALDLQILHEMGVDLDYRGYGDSQIIENVESEEEMGIQNESILPKYGEMGKDS